MAQNFSRFSRLEPLVLGTLVLVSGCGGGSSGSPIPSSVPPSVTDIEGLYAGTLTIDSTTYPLYAIALSDGTVQAYQEVGTYAANIPAGVVLDLGTVSTSDDSFSGQFDAYASYGVTLPSGSSTGTGSISGTITPEESISGTFTEAGGSGSISLQFDSVDYDRASSLSTIAGTYTFGYNYEGTLIGGSITISSNGSLDGSDDAGCTYSGSVAVPNSTYNAYIVTSIASCPNQASETATGLATYFPAGTGATVNGSNYPTNSIVAILNNTTSGYALVLVQ